MNLKKKIQCNYYGTIFIAFMYEKENFVGHLLNRTLKLQHFSKF